MTKNKTYYYIGDDIEEYPEAWCYVIIGGRNTGKTYGALDYHLKIKEPHVFVKRHNNDIDILTAGNKLGQAAADYEIDLSPYKSINRDKGTHIKAFKIDDGLGAFYNSEEGKAIGYPVGYLVSLTAIHKYKGFDLSECVSIIDDEFIPQKWEKVNRSEGDQIMELYKTVARDRELKGKPELKLILLANAVNIFNYTCEVLEIVDIIADMSASGRETLYLDDRRIFIRILKTSEVMMNKEKESGIYKAMHNTAWGRMAFDNEFAYNDFSNIKKLSLKGYQPMIELLYKEKHYFIYSNDNGYYMCSSRAKCDQFYDLNKEMDQRRFYYDHIIDFTNRCIEGLMKFEKYSMYDLIVNYKQRFVIRR